MYQPVLIHGDITRHADDPSVEDRLAPPNIEKPGKPLFTFKPDLNTAFIAMKAEISSDRASIPGQFNGTSRTVHK